MSDHLTNSESVALAIDSIIGNRRGDPCCPVLKLVQ
jgi:hypothetical protein